MGLHLVTQWQSPALQSAESFALESVSMYDRIGKTNRTETFV